MNQIRHGYRLLLLLFVPIVVWSAFVVGRALATDPRLTECGASGDNVVMAAFEIPRAKDYKMFLPGMLENPELLRVPEPAFVVVFEGPYRANVSSGPHGFTPELRNVVCFLLPEKYFPSHRIIYSDVDLAGLTTS
ncbi:MAG TPA: hypothetical protein VM344_06930 [Vitreimonas sp.]|nr:hypothetical protein [Vitreimonas sp.]